MAIHSFSRVWLHIVWNTKGQRKLLTPFAAANVSHFLYRSTKEQGILMVINYVNAEHVHLLLDLPVELSIAAIVKQLKGASSRFINQRGLTQEKFSWGRGYGVFSVSHAHKQRVTTYIATQSEHHCRKSFGEEYRKLMEHYELQIGDGT